MVCILLTAGCMLICYVHLKGFGQTTKRNATSLLQPGCRAPGQAETSAGKGNGVLPKNPGKGTQVVGREDVVSRGNILPLPKKKQKAGEDAQRRQGSWQPLGIPFDGGCLKLQPDTKNLMVRTARAEVRFVYKS